MAEYINRDAFLEQQRAWYCKDCNWRMNTKGKIVYEIGEVPCRACEFGTVLDAVEDYPAADVVEVVRCKDCMYCQKDKRGLWCFNDYENDLTENDFCSHGKRKNGTAYADGDYYCASGERKNDG